MAVKVEPLEQRYVTEFLHAERIAPTDIHQYLLNVYKDKAMNVRTVRWFLSVVATVM